VKCVSTGPLVGCVECLKHCTDSTAYVWYHGGNSCVCWLTSVVKETMFHHDVIGALDSTDSNSDLALTETQNNDPLTPEWWPGLVLSLSTIGLMMVEALLPLCQL